MADPVGVGSSTLDPTPTQRRRPDTARWNQAMIPTKCNHQTPNWSIIMLSWWLCPTSRRERGSQLCSASAGRQKRGETTTSNVVAALNGCTPSALAGRSCSVRRSVGRRLPQALVGSVMTARGPPSPGPSGPGPLRQSLMPAMTIQPAAQPPLLGPSLKLRGLRPPHPAQPQHRLAQEPQHSWRPVEKDLTADGDVHPN